MSQFDIEFEEEILAQALKDVGYVRLASRVLEAHHFSSKQMGWIWSAAQETWKKNGEVLTASLLLARINREFAKEEDQRPVIELALKLYKKPITSPRATLDELMLFVRYVRLQSAMESSIKHLEMGDVDQAYDLLRKPIQGDIRKNGHEEVRWFEEFNERVKDSKWRKEHPEDFPTVKTGLPALDKVLDGGIQPGEVGLVIGTTGRGKSIFLNHLGFNAIVARKHVLHFSLEMPARQVALRYDSRFIGYPHKKFKKWGFNQKEEDFINVKLQRAKKSLANRLRIVSMPLRRCDIASVRSVLEEVRREMPVDVILIDSGDHLRGMGRFESIRLEQAEVYWDMKNLATEENIGIWSSTQAGKDWEVKTIVRTGAASESYDKERIADIVLTLNAKMKPKSRSTTQQGKEGEEDDKQEEEQQAAPVTPAKPGVVGIDMFLTKYRDGESKLKIPLSADFTRMLIKEDISGEAPEEDE